MARGSRIRKACRTRSNQPRPTAGIIWWVMCFWYQSGAPRGAGPVIAFTTRRQSVGCEAITASRIGWSMPVAAR